MSKNFIIKNAGFTLLEMLLSVSIISILTSIGAPVYQSFQVRNDLDISANTVVQSLRRAQTLSMASFGDTSWGVRLDTGQIILFKGLSFASRDADYDEMFSMSLSITPTGLNEVVYTKFTGAPQITGNIVLTTNTNETRTITINEKGMVNF